MAVGALDVVEEQEVVAVDYFVAEEEVEVDVGSATAAAAVQWVVVEVGGHYFQQQH